MIIQKNQETVHLRLKANALKFFCPLVWKIDIIDNSSGIILRLTIDTWNTLDN